jgi:hypothetical protein
LNIIDLFISLFLFLLAAVEKLAGAPNQCKVSTFQKTTHSMTKTWNWLVMKKIPVFSPSPLDNLQSLHKKVSISKTICWSPRETIFFWLTLYIDIA